METLGSTKPYGRPARPRASSLSYGAVALPECPHPSAPWERAGHFSHGLISNPPCFFPNVTTALGPHRTPLPWGHFSWPENLAQFLAHR